jgi:hypothetical protein
VEKTDKKQKSISNYSTDELILRFVNDGIVDEEGVSEFFKEEQIDGKDLEDFDDKALEDFKQDLKV